jgi:hypothetical protein
MRQVLEQRLLHCLQPRLHRKQRQQRLQPLLLLAPPRLYAGPTPPSHAPLSLLLVRQQLLPALCAEHALC